MEIELRKKKEKTWCQETGQDRRNKVRDQEVEDYRRKKEE